MSHDDASPERREQAKQGRRRQHQQPPWNTVAERANQLGQIDLGHLLGAAHDMQPLALVARGRNAMKPLVHIAMKATNHTPAKIVIWAPSCGQ